MERKILIKYKKEQCESCEHELEDGTLCYKLNDIAYCEDCFERYVETHLDDFMDLIKDHYEAEAEGVEVWS